jgi:hypothetical protein
MFFLPEEECKKFPLSQECEEYSLARSSLRIYIQRVAARSVLWMKCALRTKETEKLHSF